MHKLTANFHLNLEIEDLGASGKAIFEVEPKFRRPYCPDCRHVAFRPNANVGAGRFGEIMQSLQGRIGFDASRSW
jgi:hypothetical protein